MPEATSVYKRPQIDHSIGIGPGAARTVAAPSQTAFRGLTGAAPGKAVEFIGVRSAHERSPDQGIEASLSALDSRDGAGWETGESSAISLISDSRRYLNPAGSGLL
jgi:hypothetical protein